MGHIDASTWTACFHGIASAFMEAFEMHGDFTKVNRWQTIYFPDGLFQPLDAGKPRLGLNIGPFGETVGPRPWSGAQKCKF